MGNRKPKIDMNALRQKQKDLEKRAAGSSLFVNAGQIQPNDGYEVKAMPARSNMDGIYFLELKIWWVNNKKIICPSNFGGEDIVQTFKDEINSLPDNDKNKSQLQKLMQAQGSKGPKVSRKYDYWLPVLKFNWDIKGDEIVGIENDKGEIDPKLVDKYIEESRVKILTSGPQLFTSINQQLTTRGGLRGFEPNGFNLTLTKTGQGRDTRYSATRTVEDIPVLDKYYSEDQIPDILNIAKAGAYNEDYVEAIMKNYLFGEELNEPTDKDYMFPEVRQSLKDNDNASSKLTHEQDSNTDEQESDEASEENVDEDEADQEDHKPKSRLATKKDTSKLATKSTGKLKRGGIKRSVLDDMKDPDDA